MSFRGCMALFIARQSFTSLNKNILFFTKKFKKTIELLYKLMHNNSLTAQNERGNENGKGKNRLSIFRRS